MEDKELKDVPTDSVGEVAQSFAHEGYKTIRCEMVADNNWTISASNG